jgi:tetratricopeptide (TPR) repeat protein
VTLSVFFLTSEITGRREDRLHDHGGHMTETTRSRTPRLRRAAHSIPAGVALALVALLSVAAAAPAAQPANVDSLLARGGRALDKNQADKAERLFLDALSLSKNDARAENGLAVVGLLRGDSDAAIEHARKAIKRDKKNAEYHLTLANGYGLKAMKGGMTAMFYGGKYKQECELAIKYDPESVAAYMAILQFYVLAPPIAGGGRDKAEQTVATIARLDPLSGHLARAFVARQNKDLAGAEREYLAAARLDSQDPKGWRSLGMFYIDVRRYKDAIEVGERILTLAPDDLATVYQLAKAHLLLGDDLSAAESGFKRYIAAENRPAAPDLASVHWRLGMVYEKGGRFGEARAEWQRALTIDPSNKNAAADLDTLRTTHPELGR